MRKLLTALAMALTLALITGAAFAAVTGSLKTTATQKEGPKKLIRKAKKGKSVQLKFNGSVTGELDSSTSGSLDTITNLKISGSGGITASLKDAETCTAEVLNVDGIGGCDATSVLAKIDLTTVKIGSNITGKGSLYFVYAGKDKVIMFADVTELTYNNTQIGPLKLAFANTTISSTEDGFSLDIDLSALLSTVGSATSSLSGPIDIQLNGTVGSKSDSPLRVVQCPRSKKWTVKLTAGAIEQAETIPCKYIKKKKKHKKR